MGMFDNLRCEYPLPDAAAQNFDFQTQSFDCLLDDYVITKEGRLVKRPNPVSTVVLLFPPYSLHDFVGNVTWQLRPRH